MKRAPVILFGLFFSAVSVLQYRLIAASLTSFAAWCVLAISHPESMGRFWAQGLGEYWLAGVVWIAAGAWLLRRTLHPRRGSGKHVLFLSSQSSGSGRWSQRLMGCMTFVALTSPFLTPIDPNVQGNLVTTRLLPPFSRGYVREYLGPEEVDPRATDVVHQTFLEANNVLLHRTMSVSRDPAVFPGDSPRGGNVVREYSFLFLCGTDDNARDAFSRVIAGARVSLGVGLSAALGALLIGATIGFASALFRGFTGILLMRLTDLFLAVPSLFLVIGAIAFAGQSITTIILVLSLTGWMGIARIVRGESVSLQEREFILAAKLLRISQWRIVSRHLWPNLRPVMMTAAVLQFANAVLGEAALGFLGLGVQPPTATWGNMMGEATGYLGSAWWVGVFPGILLAAVLVSAHTMGERSTGTPDEKSLITPGAP